MIRPLLPILLLSWCTPVLADSPRDLSWVLDYGPPAEWSSAIQELSTRQKGIPSKAAASVLRRQEIMTGSTRVTMVKALGERGLTWDARVLHFLQQEARHGEPAAAKAALDGLLKSYNPAAIPLLIELFEQTTDWQKPIADRLISVSRSETGEAIHGPDGGSYYPHEAATLAKTGHRAPLFYGFYRHLATHPDRDLRYQAADKLRYFADQRTDSLLWMLSQDHDAELGEKALWSLGRRRNAQACDILLERVWTNGVEATRRNSDLADLGGVCGPTHLFSFFELAETSSPDRRDQIETLLDKATGWSLLPLLSDEKFRVRIEYYRNSSDPAVRQSVNWLLAKEAEQKYKQFIKQRPPLLGPAVLIFVVLVSALLGLVLFVWGVRLLQLLRLLQRMAPSTVHSVHQGTALLRGRLKPVEELLEHPVTEENCLYYSGADRDHPYQQFYLEDGTGQILVNPAGAVLLSADGILSRNEEVMMLGLVSRTSGERKINVIGKPNIRRSLFDRILHFMVQGVLGFWSRNGTGMAHFSDPRRCFWIWDNLEDGPMRTGPEVVRLLFIFLAAGLWIGIFATTALAMFDQQISAVLAAWLELAK